MKRSLLGGFVVTLVLSAGGAGRAQTGIPCYHDWSLAPRQHFLIRDGAEYKHILSACAQKRAETVPWDEYLQMFQTAASMRALDGDMQTNLQRLVEMVRKERDHVRNAASARPPASAVVPLPGDSNLRHFDLGLLINQPVRQPDRLMVDPAFRSWVPRLLREAVASRHGFQARIVDFKGEASIRRGNEVARISDLLQRGNAWNLQAGDIFEVHQGHIEFDFGNGARYTLQAGGALMMHMDAQCVSRRNALTGRLLRDAPIYLIQGPLLYATTTNPVQASCAVVLPGVTVSTRGTSFSVRYTPAEMKGTMEVTVTSGLVDVTETDTGQVWELRPGESRTLKVLEPPPPVKGNDFIVTNHCSQSVRFKLFEADGQGRLVATWPEHNIAAGRGRAIAISDPVVGNQICYGAVSEDDGRSWGIGPEGDKDCDRCCWTTRPQPAIRRVNLTCR